MIIVKLDQALMIHANWPKLCQHTHFKLLPAKVMLLSACANLLHAERFLMGSLLQP